MKRRAGPQWVCGADGQIGTAIDLGATRPYHLAIEMGMESPETAREGLMAPTAKYRR